eukprot:2397755-Pyramimonas_sp.AAC.1
MFVALFLLLPSFPGVRPVCARECRAAADGVEPAASEASNVWALTLPPSIGLTRRTSLSQPCGRCGWCPYCHNDS